MEKKQIIGILILLVLLGGIMFTVNFVSHHLPPSTIHNPPNWDSIRAARWDSAKAYWDSVRVVRRDSAKAYWDSVRIVRRDSSKAYWDSVRIVRRDSAKAYWDSVRQARRDSVQQLLKDSVRRTYSTSYPIKKDTILDLNSADTTELKYLRGIGPYIAKRIVQYRKDLGGYVSVEQLREIEPLCDYDLSDEHMFKFDSVLPHLWVNTDSVRRMPVNRMSAGALSKHPYLRFDQAKAVYEQRRRKFNLKSIDDIRPLIGDSLATTIQPYLDFTPNTKH